MIEIYLKKLNVFIELRSPSLIFIHVHSASFSKISRYYLKVSRYYLDISCYYLKISCYYLNISRYYLTISRSYLKTLVLQVLTELNI
jgi:hypothetical protein